MNTDNLITPEGLAASLEMAAEAMKKKRLWRDANQLCPDDRVWI